MICTKFAITMATFGTRKMFSFRSKTILVAMKAQNSSEHVRKLKTCNTTLFLKNKAVAWGRKFAENIWRTTNVAVTSIPSIIARFRTMSLTAFRTSAGWVKNPFVWDNVPSKEAQSQNKKKENRGRATNGAIPPCDDCRSLARKGNFLAILHFTDCLLQTSSLLLSAPELNLATVFIQGFSYQCNNLVLTKKGQELIAYCSKTCGSAGMAENASRKEFNNGDETTITL